MEPLPDRATMISRLLAAARQDERIVGLLEYGSGSEGRSDQYSDLDVAVFIREPDFAPFEQEWQAWASRLGPLLLAYLSGVGHPWTVYDATPLPLRVDFVFYPDTAAEQILTWPSAPTSVAAMVWYDATEGRLTAYASQLVGQSLAPQDLAATFTRISGDFWYYSVRVLGKMERGDEWAARYEFTVIVTGLLHALLRLEVGAVARWKASEAAVGIVQALSPQRRTQLQAVIPASEIEGVRAALGAAMALGEAVCAHLHDLHGWPWPERLAARLREILGPPPDAMQPPMP